MWLYGVRKYCLNAVGFAVSITVVAGVEMLPQILVGASLVAIWFTHREFERKHLWPMFDNLQISRRSVFIAPAIGLILIAMVLRAWV